MLYDLNLEVLNEDEVVGFEIVILGIFEIDVFDEVNGQGLGECRYGIVQF